jgi:acetamidase/formamidase
MDCTTTIQVDLIKNWNIAWPRLENKDFIMTIGSTRPMEDAARIVYEAYFRIDPEAISAGQSLSETAKEFAERRLQMRRSGWWFAQR